MAPKVSAQSNRCGPKPAGAGPHVRPATAKKQARTAAATIASIILSPAAAFAEDAVTAYERMTGTAASVVPAAAAASSTDLPSITDDPLLLAGAAAAVAIPVIAAVALRSSAGPKIQATSALKAFELLGDTGAVLLDVRSKAAVKEEGVPDLRSIKRKAVVIPFSKVNRKGEVLIDEEAFSAQLARSSLIKEDNVVIVLDSDGSEAGTVAKLLAEAKPEVSRILTVQRGTEAWKAGDLPWREPSKGLDFNVDLTKLNLAAMADRVDVIAEQYQRNPSVANGLLAAGVIAGASVLLATEIETVLEVVGVVAAGQFLVRQMLFADNREQLAQDLRTLFTEKIAAGEAAEDFKRLAAAILDTEVVEEGAAEPPAAAPVAAAKPAPAAVADAPGTAAASEAAEVKAEGNPAKGETGNTNPTEAGAAAEPAEEAKLAQKPAEAAAESQPADVVASEKPTEVSDEPAETHAPGTAAAVSAADVGPVAPYPCQLWSPG